MSTHTVSTTLFSDPQHAQPLTLAVLSAERASQLTQLLFVAPEPPEANSLAASTEDPEENQP